jgi:hypothetical protein
MRGWAGAAAWVAESAGGGTGIPGIATGPPGIGLAGLPEPFGDITVAPVARWRMGAD